MKIFMTMGTLIWGRERERERERERMKVVARVRVGITRNERRETHDREEKRGLER